MKRSIVVLAGLALTLVGCGAPPSEAFGLSLSSQGTVELRFGRCLGGWDIWVRPRQVATRSVWALREDRGSGRAAGHLPPGHRRRRQDHEKGWREVTKS